MKAAKDEAGRIKGNATLTKENLKKWGITVQQARVPHNKASNRSIYLTTFLEVRAENSGLGVSGLGLQAVGWARLLWVRDGACQGAARCSTAPHSRTGSRLWSRASPCKSRRAACDSSCGSTGR